MVTCLNTERVQGAYIICMLPAWLQNDGLFWYRHGYRLSIALDAPCLLSRKPCTSFLSLTFPSCLFLWRHREHMPAQFPHETGKGKLPHPFRVIVPFRSVKGEFVEPVDNIVIRPMPFMRFGLFKKPMTASTIATNRVLTFKENQSGNIRAACAFGGQDRTVNSAQVESDELACGLLMLSVKHLNRNRPFQTGDKVNQGGRFVTMPDAVRYPFTIELCDILMLDIEQRRNLYG